MLQQAQILDDYDIKLMSPAKRDHARVQARINKIFNQALKERDCEVYTESRPILIPKDILEKYRKLYGDKFKEQFPKKYVIPDIVVVCDKEIDKEIYIEGAPTLIVEILSTKTMKIDTGYKKEMYEEIGVKEYWIVDPLYKYIEIFDFINNVSSFLSIEDIEESKEVGEEELPMTSPIFPELIFYLSFVFEGV